MNWIKCFLLIMGLIVSSSLVVAEPADTLWQRFIDEGAVNANIPDFSSSGFFAKNSALNTPPEIVFNVLDFNAIPHDGIDDRQSIQLAINAASENGGSIVY